MLNLINFSIIFVFYLFIPLIGTINSFFDFRKKRLLLYNIKFFENLAFAKNFSEKHYYKVMTKVESIKGNSLLMSSLNLKIEINKPNIKIYTPYLQENYIKINKFQNILQGTNLLIIAKFIQKENGYAVNIASNKLLLMFNDKKNFFKKVFNIFSSSNYFWNNLTAFSLLSGFFIFAYYTINYLPNYSEKMLDIILYTLMPFMPLIPPGFVFYFFHKILTKYSNKTFNKIFTEFFNLKNRNIKENMNFKFFIKRYKNRITKGILALILAYLLILFSIYINFRIFFILFGMFLIY